MRRRPTLLLACLLVAGCPPRWAGPDSTHATADSRPSQKVKALPPADARGVTGTPSARRPSEEDLPELPVPCDHSPVDGWHPHAPGPEQDAVVEALAKEAEREATVGVTSCERNLALRCAPDLDGDGHPETLARMGWTVPVATGEEPVPSCEEALRDPSVLPWRFEVMGIFSRPSPGRWTTRALLLSRVQDGQTDTEVQVGEFVRLPDGRVAMRSTRRMYLAAEDCDAWSERVEILTPAGLTTVQEQARPCQ